MPNLVWCPSDPGQKLLDSTREQGQTGTAAGAQTAERSEKNDEETQKEYGSHVGP